MDGNGTQARIAGAFQRILRGKAYDSVTVREIAKEAGVTPRTFYSHFRSKGELLSFMLLSDLSGADIPGHAAGWERIGLLLSHLRRNRKLYRIMGQESPDRIAHTHFSRALRGFIIGSFPHTEESMQPLSLIADGMVAAIYRWLSEPIAMPEAEILDDLKASVSGLAPISKAMQGNLIP